MTLAEIQTDLANIDAIRQKINAYIVAAFAAGIGKDAVALMASLAADVATSGSNPADILTTITALTQINADLNAAAAAVKAEQPTG